MQKRVTTSMASLMYNLDKTSKQMNKETWNMEGCANWLKGESNKMGVALAALGRELLFCIL